jgi:hypothetical protein
MDCFNFQKGWTLWGALFLIIAAVSGSLAFTALLLVIPEGKTVIVPWAMVSIFLLPITFSVQLFFKLTELKDQKELSRDERRRLATIVDEKLRQIKISILFYIVSALFIACSFMLADSNHALFNSALIIAGGLLGITLASVGLIFSETQSVTDFKSKIQNRETERKRQRATLKRLKSKETSQS